jgi:hypothetical protein
MIDKEAAYGKIDSTQFKEPPMTENLTIRIGDIGIAFDGEPRIEPDEIKPAYRPFISTSKPDIHLRMHLGAPQIKIGKKVFESSPIWTLYGQGEDFIIKLFEKMNGLERILRIPRDFTAADLYFAEPNGSFNDPFFGPIIELLMVNYLAQIDSMIVHACGVDYENRGILFVGESGAGKSTLTKIWNQEPGVEILSDDRIIIRKKNNQYWMYGTPWHGDAKFASPAKLKLEKIFFIRHGQKNSIKAMGGTLPVLQFLKASFPPFWDKKCMQCAMEFFNDLAATVPCRELSFVPDSKIVGFVDNLL